MDMAGKGKPGPEPGQVCEKIVLDDAQIAQCKKLSGIGLNLDQLAAYLELSPKTLDNIIKRQPEVGYAIKKGKAEAIGTVASTLFQMATGQKSPDGKGYIREPHPSSIFFFLKTQGRWVEAKEDLATDDEDEYEEPESMKLEDDAKTPTAD